MRRMALAVALWSTSLALADTTPTYTVRVGDTLYAIARAHGSSVPELMTLNGLVSPTVQVGQALRLPRTTPAPTARPPVVISPELAAQAGLPAETVTTTLSVESIPATPLGTTSLVVPPVTIPTPPRAPAPAAPSGLTQAPAPGAAPSVLDRTLPPLRVTLPPAPALPRVDAAAAVRGPRVWKQPVSVTHTGSTVARGGVVQAASFTATAALPPRAFLGGLSFAFQSHNNCGPASVAGVLSYYGYRVSQEDLRRVLRPRGGYMRVDVIAPYLRKYGLTARVTRGGTLGNVKTLVAQGVPVIVLQWYDRVGHIPHFRVVRGYDDAAGVVWVSDSMVGAVTYLSYRDFDRLWNTQGRQMIGVYPNTLPPRG